MDAFQQKMGHMFSTSDIDKILLNGEFELLYQKLFKSGITQKSTREDIEKSNKQIRKILDMIREIKNVDEKKKCSTLIKVLVFLEYQSKRRVIKEELKNYYKMFLERALELGKNNPKVFDNLYDVIEAITVALL
ncbi:MAG: type III-A CRISPR-associated protein Csm2 [Candidatus Aenigmatarchaeota archaeon]